MEEVEVGMRGEGWRSRSWRGRRDAEYWWESGADALHAARGRGLHAAAREALRGAGRTTPLVVRRAYRDARRRPDGTSPRLQTVATRTDGSCFARHRVLSYIGAFTSFDHFL